MWEYIRRGITRRRKQTLIISIGMALAVAAVVVVSSASRGIAQAQSSVLESVYGVGTDLTVTAAVGDPGEAQSGEAGQSGGRQQFDFREGSGETGDDGATSLSTTRLSVAMGTSTMDTGVLDTVSSTEGVSTATGTLALTQMDFSGQVQQQEDSGSTADGTTGDGGTDQGSTPGGPGGQGGPGFGGGSFSFGQTTILGVDPSATEVGPTTGMTVSDGSLLSADDADQAVAVISASYASDNDLAVGDTVALGSDATEFTVVGVLSEESSQDASDIYIPLSLAQQLADEDGAVTTIYVKAASADTVDSVASALEDALPDQTVSTQSDLASTVTGSLSSAASWISGFGTWLTVGILVLAFLLTSLFTISSVTRRTRELGTLKAIGWSNGRVLGNVVSETLIQTLIGGLIGLALGVAAILGVNAAGITLTGSAGGSGGFQMGGMPGSSQQAGGPQAPGGSDQTAPTTSDGSGQGVPGGDASDAAADQDASATSTTLTLEPSAMTLGLALGAGLLGGAVAGGAGAIAVSRLRPAAALRSVE
jgi:ABC-type lipoprotein release transport system permease subunit